MIKKSTTLRLAENFEEDTLRFDVGEDQLLIDFLLCILVLVS